MVISNRINSVYRSYRCKKYAINLSIILFLLISNLIIGQYFRDNLEDVLYNSDDVIHISVAHSFQIHKTFDLTFLQNNPGIVDSDNFIVYYPSVIHTYYDKGPVYYILLGSFYQLLGTTSDNFYLHASIFNNILVWVFLVLFFFFVKNKFNLQTAFLSSVLVLFTPYTAWMGTRVVLYFPFMIFDLAALFFLEKRKIHYFLFGIFAGLAHLTHPFGIFIGSTYCLFLLINKEFRGFLITFAAWNLTLLPWLVRNYYFFKDVGWGLFLPFSEKISDLIFFIPQQSTHVISPNYVSPSILYNTGIINPLKMFVGTFDTEISELLHMDYLILFVMLLTFFAFFKIEKLRINFKLILLPILVSIYVALYFYTDTYLSIFFIFLLPVFLIYFFHKRYHHLFVSSINRTTFFIIFFMYISLIGFYFMNLKYADGYPEIQQLMLPLFLIIPFALEGLYRIINLVKKKKSIFLKVPVFIIVSLVLFPMIIQMVASYPELNHYSNDLNGSQDNMMKITNKWIMTNIHDKVIASNYPAMTFLHTGLNSVPLPLLPDQDAFERYLDHYNVSYLVFYKNSNVPTNELYADINSWHTVRFGYVEVYSVNGSHVIKLFNKIDSADISNPVLYLEKASKLEKLGEISDATKIYDEVKTLKPKTVDIEEKICNSFTKIKKYDYAISSCNYMLNKNANDPVALSNLAMLYQETGQRDKTLGIISTYDKMLLDGQNAEVIKYWYDMIPQLIKHDPSIKLDIVKDISSNVQLSEEQSNLKKALLLYVEIQYLDSSQIYSSNLHYVDLHQFKTLGDALKSVDLLIQFYTTHNAQELSMNSFLLHNSLVYALNEKAKLLIAQQQFDAADNTYLDMEMLDNFNDTIHEKRALLLEQLNSPKEALKEYHFQERLTPDDLAIQKKITDLNIKIKNQTG